MRIKIKNIAITLALPTLILFCLGTLAQAQFEPAGQALVVDVSEDALFSVDLTPGFLGNRTLVSDFDDPSQGPIGGSPRAVACEDPRRALVVDESAGTENKGLLFSVKLRPPSLAGDRTIISDFGDPSQGPTGQSPRGVILDGSGNALVVDSLAGTNSDGALFHVDLETGDRTLISDFGNPAQGPLGARPHGLALENASSVLVADEDAGTNSDGILFRVDLATGQRTIISDFGDPLQGPIGADPFDVALDSSGNALVTDDDTGTNGLGALFSVDLITGQRTIVSDFGDPSQGPLGQDPIGVALDGSGNALVIDEDGVSADGTLFIVDLTPGPTFGDRVVASNFGDPAQGPLGQEPRGVAFKPPPPLARPIPTLSEWGLIAMAGMFGIAGLLAVRRRAAA